jgi:hypothetical protein
MADAKRAPVRLTARGAQSRNFRTVETSPATCSRVARLRTRSACRDRTR